MIPIIKHEHLQGGTTITIDVDMYAKTTYVESIMMNKVAKSGDTMTGRLDMAGNNISNVSNPLSNQDAATKSYVDTLGALKLSKAENVKSGALSMGGNKITDVGNPAHPQDTVTKYYIEQPGIPKFVVTSGNIPNLPNSNIISLSGKMVSNGKITIASLWVEGLVSGLTATVANLILQLVIF